MGIKNDSNFQVVYPVLARQWHPVLNGALKPSDIPPCSNTKVWWKCNQGHEYPMSPNKRAVGRGCPNCNRHVSMIEFCLYLCILKSYPETIFQYKVDEKWKVDIFVKEINTCLEYDGYRWHNDRIERDIRKNEKLTKLKYNVVRLREEGLTLNVEKSKQIRVNSSRNMEGCI